MPFGRNAVATFFLPLLCAPLSGDLLAQKIVSARAGLITYVQGSATLENKRVVLKATRFPQMKPGQVLSTAGGRAELLLSPGVMLRLGENSQLCLDNDLLAETRVTLFRGDALVEVVQLPEGNRIQMAVGETITELTRPGLYRFGILQNGTSGSLRVYGGEALARSGEKSLQVKRGMSVRLDPHLESAKFDRKQTDALHAWAARRSFNLFLSDPDARQKQNHWQLAGGYAENKNFGTVFRVAVRGRMPSPAFRPIPPAEVGAQPGPASGR